MGDRKMNVAVAVVASQLMNLGGISGNFEQHRLHRWGEHYGDTKHQLIGSWKVLRYHNDTMLSDGKIHAIVVMRKYPLFMQLCWY